MENERQSYKCKSVIIGRRFPREQIIDGEVVYPCFVNLCDFNNPHLSTRTPFKFLDFMVHKVIIKGLVVNYLIPGNDIVINNLRSITVEKKGPHLIISGDQDFESENKAIYKEDKGQI